MSRRQNYLTCSRKYDLPLYCAGWTSAVNATTPSGESKPAGSSTEQQPNEDEASAEAAGDVGHVLLGGGGGDRKSGLLNQLLLAQYNFSTDDLSEAITTFSTDDDPPYRLAVHPGSNEIVSSVAKDCRVMTLKSDEGLKLEASEKSYQPLQDIGEQKCLVFSTDGTRLATGGEDGHLRVFEWPSLNLVLDEPGAHQSVRDLDFSLDSSLLASTGDSGPCRIWDIAKASAVASLSSDKGEGFGFCRFSRDGTRPVLFVTLRAAGNGLIGLWETATWKKLSAKKVTDAPISAFSISPNGKLIAVGSSEGDLIVVDSKKLATIQKVKSAHMIFVTSMEFAPNSRAVLSVSGDSSARVTAVNQSNREGYRAYIAMLIVLLIGALVYLVYGDSNGEKSLGGFVDTVKAGLSRFDTATKRTFEQIPLD